MNDDQYALPALLVAFGGTPDTLEQSKGQEEAPVDIPAHLAQKLWENPTLRHALFNPNQFKHLCENIIRWEILQLEARK